MVGTTAQQPRNQRAGRTGIWSRRLTVAVAAAALAVVNGCTSDDQLNGTITVAAAGGNTLQAVVETTTTEPTDIVIEVTADGVATRSIASNADGPVHAVTVVGLRAETTYGFRALTVDGAELGETVEHTTGTLPDGAPEVEIIDAAAADGTAADGITFFGLSAVGAGAGAANNNDDDRVGPAYWGVDSAGEIVWYLDHEAGQDPVVRDLGNGEILVFTADSVDRLTLAGHLISSFDLSSIRGWHHDARLMPDGGVLLLGRETRDVAGLETRGDTVVRLDANGSTIFEWSTFDHLDPSRFPGELSLAESRGGGRDWTHANSVFLDAERNQILVSLRSQHWIVAINADSGDVEWIAGDGDGTGDFDAPFLELTSGSWTSGQHAAIRTTDGALFVYDNRNESGGETNNSRAVVYSVDEASMTATQVTEVVMPKYTRSLGDIDVMADGGLLATAGGPGSNDTAYLVEAGADGTVLWTAAVDGRIYRSERISWGTIDSATATAANAATAVTATGEVSPGDEETAIDDQAAAEPDADNQDAGGDGNDNTNGNGRNRNGNGNGGRNNRQPAVAPPSIDDLTDPVDLTGEVLAATAASCADYQGHYTATSTDTSNGNVFQGALIVAVEGETCVIQSNSIPNHDVSVNTSFAHETGEVATRFEIPTNPQLADEPTVIDLNPHVIMLNGVVWEAYPAACFDAGDGNNLGAEAVGCGPDQLDHPWRYNLGSDLNVFRLDDYYAHSQADGLYHYHRTPQALYTIECDGADESPVIGFARDGFPVFGPCFTDADGLIRSAQSSFQLRTGLREDVAGYLTPYTVGRVESDEYNGQFVNDYEYVEGAGDLDACNGMTVNGQYGYYLTGGFPYVLSCLAGTPSEVFGRAG